MSELTVNLYTRGENPVILPVGLALTVNRLAATAQGGYDACEIEVSGSELALHAVRSWLRYRVEVVGPPGLCWEGRVTAIDLRLGGVTVSVSTEQMFNAIKVIYSYTGDDGGSESGETDWLTDADSINEFGRKEALHSSGGETTREGAEALRATVLAGAAKAGQPVVSVEGAEGEVGATLYCQGRFHDLEWRYHQQATGYEAHEDIDKRALLGWTYSNTSLGFIANYINKLLDFSGANTLAALEEGDQLKITGTWSGSNDGVKVVKDGTGGDAQNYTASTISFDPADDVLDSANGLGFLRAKEALQIIGTTGGQNDGFYVTSDVVGDDRIEVSTYGASPVVGQAAGPSITLRMGQSVELTAAPAAEGPGNNITLTAYGQRIAMRFEIVDGPWQVGEVGVHIAKHGCPTDDVQVQIWSDSGNAPLAQLTAGALAAADIPAQQAGWRTAKLTTPVTLANGVKYHIVLARAGASHHANYYTVSLDSTGTYPRGDLRLWDGAVWQTRSSAAHMAFKLWAVLDSTAKIAEIVADTIGSVTGTYAQNMSGVRTRKIRDGRTTAWEEIKQLLDTGAAGGKRLLARVTPAGTLILDAEPGYDAQTALIWTRDRRLREASGRYLLRGALPVGRWVQVESLLVADWQADTSRFLIDSVEYDARNGRWTLRPPQAADPFDVGTEQG